MIESPCNKVCVLDAVTGWCIGCGRTGGEIGAWLTMTDAEQTTLVAQLPARLASMVTRDGRREARRARATSG
ncbi:DUF1289 domain-containing protein [Falsiroseomonas sp. HW251]|uniref:DUF1289 domain-containing protein n=1 Tax=Falsiroseomonas sp. HW251 TaxID=3390998 RepID=UPI003D32420D